MEKTEFNESLASPWTMKLYRITLFYCEIKCISKNSLIFTPSHLLIYMKTKQLTGLENSSFLLAITIALSFTGVALLLYFLHLSTFFLLLLLCLLLVLQHSYISYFCQLFSFISYIHVILHPCSFYPLFPIAPWQVFPNFADFQQNNSLFMQKNHKFKKFYPLGKFRFQQLVVNFTDFQLNNMCAKKSCT